MKYCNSKECKKINTCKKHIINTDDGLYNIINYYNKECFDDNFVLYETIQCKNCGKLEIWAKGLCKVCYYKNKDYPRKYNYIPVIKKSDNNIKICNVENCNNKVVAKNLCMKHYKQQRRELKIDK